MKVGNIRRRSWFYVAKNYRECSDKARELEMKVLLTRISTAVIFSLSGKKKTQVVKTWVLRVRAWQFPTFAWQTATLSSALSGFTSEFGMGSGGSRSLWSPSKLVLKAGSRYKAQGERRLLAFYPDFCLGYVVSLSFMCFRLAASAFNSVQARPAATAFALPLWPCACFWKSVTMALLSQSRPGSSLLSAVLQRLSSLFRFQSSDTQTDWVLYGQASRAISTR